MTPASHAGGPEFEPRLAYLHIYGRIAQMVEHGSNKPRVGGSSPSWSMTRSYSVMVITKDFESFDPGSSPGRTFCFFLIDTGHCRDFHPPLPPDRYTRVHSSAVEHGIADPGVAGSIPAAPFEIFCQNLIGIGHCRQMP